MKWPARSRARTIVTSLAFALPPGSLKNRLLRRIPGIEVHITAHVAPSLVWNIEAVRLGAHTRIGTGNVVRDMRMLELEDYARLGQWNWISSAPPLWHLSPAAGVLTLGVHSACTSRHYLDCSGGVSIGAFATVAGVRSTFITHGIDTRESFQRTNGITIGEYALISSNCKFTPGAHVPNRCLVAMGSTVVGLLGQEDQLYAGIPARERKPVYGSFFSRQTGWVPPAPEAQRRT